MKKRMSLHVYSIWIDLAKYGTTFSHCRQNCFAPVLFQVSTGEGKSIIAVLFCLVVHLLHKRTVDVLTSNRELAERDAKEYEYADIFCAFGIGVSCRDSSEMLQAERKLPTNSDELIGLKQDIYDPKNVLYSSIHSVQVDQLLHEKDALDCRGARPFDIVLCDECDNLTLDRVLHGTQISSSLPDSPWYTILCESIFNRQAYMSGDDFQNCKAQLVEDFTHEFRQGSSNLPANAQEWMETQIPVLFDSARRSLHLERDADYLVSEGKVVPIDAEHTGQIQHGVEWGRGLSTMVAIKEQLCPNSLSLRSSYMSNLAFLKKYKSVCGMTGTMGSKQERGTLQKLYQVQIEEIPRHVARRFKEEDPVLFQDTEEERDKWRRTILDKIDQMHPRVTLVLCEHLGTAENLKQAVQDKLPGRRIYLYARDDQEDHKGVPNQCFDCGDIIISTNLGGRGTDYRITEAAAANGGAHVECTFYPQNGRVEEQAFGRAARNGRDGSGRIVAVIDESSGIPRGLREIMYLSQIPELAAEDRKKYEAFQHFCSLGLGKVVRQTQKRLEETQKRVEELHKKLQGSLAKQGDQSYHDLLNLLRQEQDLGVYLTFKALFLESWSRYLESMWMYAFDDDDTGKRNAKVEKLIRYAKGVLQDLQSGEAQCVQSMNARARDERKQDIDIELCCNHFQKLWRGAMKTELCIKTRVCPVDPRGAAAFHIMFGSSMIKCCDLSHQYVPSMFDPYGIVIGEEQGRVQLASVVARYDMVAQHYKLKGRSQRTGHVACSSKAFEQLRLLKEAEQSMSVYMERAWRDFGTSLLECADCAVQDEVDEESGLRRWNRLRTEALFGYLRHIKHSKDILEKNEMIRTEQICLLPSDAACTDSVEAEVLRVVRQDLEQCCMLDLHVLQDGSFWASYGVQVVIIVGILEVLAGMIVCDPVLAHMLVKHGVDDLYKGISSAVKGRKIDLEDYLVRKSLMVAADSMLLACQGAGVGDYSLTAAPGDDLQSVGQEVTNCVLDVVQKHATELFTDVACDQVLNFCIRKLTSSLIETCLGTYRRECEQRVRKALESSLNERADRVLGFLSTPELFQEIADNEKRGILNSGIFGTLDSQPLATVVPRLLSLASQGAGLEKEWDKALVAVQLADQALSLLRKNSLDLPEGLPLQLKEIASSHHTALFSQHPAHVVQEGLDSDQAKVRFQQFIKSTTDAVVNARCDAIRAELQELPARVLRPMVRQSADQAFSQFKNLVLSSLQDYPSQRNKVQDFQEVGEEHVDDRKGRPLTKRERLAKSRKQGREWEEEIRSKQRRNEVIEQVTLEPFGPDGKPVKNKKGENLQVRIDSVLLSEKAERKIRLLEAKNGPKAPLTRNQKIGYPLLEKYGGRVVSPTLQKRGYSTVPPTRVEIIRPAHGQVWSKGKVDQ